MVIKWGEMVLGGQKSNFCHWGKNANRRNQNVAGWGERIPGWERKREREREGEREREREREREEKFGKLIRKWSSLVCDRNNQKIEGFDNDQKLSTRDLEVNKQTKKSFFPSNILGISWVLFLWTLSCFSEC